MGAAILLRLGDKLAASILHHSSHALTLPKKKTAKREGPRYLAPRQLDGQGCNFTAPRLAANIQCLCSGGRVRVADGV
jgi:hypothetical protein